MSKGGYSLAGLAVAFAFALIAEACGSSDDAEPTAAEAGDAGSEPADLDASTSTGAFSEDAMRSAAGAFNEKYCRAFAECDPVVFGLTFAGMNECLDAGGLVAIPSGEVRYVDDLRAPYAYGSRLTPDNLTACAASLELLPCERWVSFTSEHIVPDACAPAFFGALEAGASCGIWNQCESGRCRQDNSAPQGSCGTCAARVVDGDSCFPHTCERGSSCRGPKADTRCTPYAGLGQTCVPNAPGRLTVSSTTRPCHDHLVCDATTNKCVEPLPNKACDPNSGCSFVPRLHYCNPAVDGGKCEPLQLADAGMPCGDVPAPQYFRLCSLGSTCSLVDLDAAAPYQCTSLVGDGKQCTGTADYETDNKCAQPDSRCFRDICQKNGAAECTLPRALP